MPLSLRKGEKHTHAQGASFMTCEEFVFVSNDDNLKHL